MQVADYSELWLQLLGVSKCLVACNEAALLHVGGEMQMQMKSTCDAILDVHAGMGLRAVSVPEWRGQPAKRRHLCRSHNAEPARQ